MQGEPAEDGPGFGFLDATPPAPAPTGGTTPGGYRVLARKYRPQTFDDLIGQEPMVRTLSNAFETGRIHQAYILTGVRGVGKTTTARILARGFNYELPGGKGGPSIHMPELGVHCRAIIEGRHVDVMEIDAASHTGIDDVRQITDGVRYAPVSARYKVYIVDEVHMLSEKAWNAFLKTLEEPPPHAKFLFATTEIRKVPITVLSRCQRFDLRRVDADLLVRHLSKIAGLEGVAIEDEALRLVARAAEGSVRDSLSLLDQAIAHGGGRVTAETVRVMLGLADRARVVDLFEAVMRGDMAAALAELADQYRIGADPAVVLTDLAEFTHFVTRLKLVPETTADLAVAEVDRVRGRAFADTLSVPQLSRAWQILLKGIDETKAAPKPLAAAEMVLVRLAYAADLPTLDEAMRQLREGGATAGGGGPAPRGGGGGGDGSAPLDAPPARMTASGGGAGGQPVARLVAEAPPRADFAPRPAAAALARPAEGPLLASLADVAALAAEKRDLMLKTGVEMSLRPVRFEDGRIEVALVKGAPASLPTDLARRLGEWTGRPWVVALSREPGGPTLAEARSAAKKQHFSDAEADPLVAAVLSRFPGARVVDVRVTTSEAADGPDGETAAPPPPDDED